VTNFLTKHLNNIVYEPRTMCDQKFNDPHQTDHGSWRFINLQLLSFSIRGNTATLSFANSLLVIILILENGWFRFVTVNRHFSTNVYILQRVYFQKKIIHKYTAYELHSILNTTEQKLNISNKIICYFLWFFFTLKLFVPQHFVFYKIIIVYINLSFGVGEGPI
jgi:hypothetical protein